ncbi:MAG: 6-phosphofructokinase [Microthrixaceae bacterium]|nr:6-phosphofructokinase [Microthrixaceae bacterium]
MTPSLLDLDGYDPMLSTGGTILGSVNRPIDAVASEIEAGYGSLGLDALIAIGGDGSLAILREHARSGWNLVAIPKTIDNDVALTDQSIGFDSAVRTVTQACSQLRSTGVSHDRVMILETMGRGAGHLALSSGIAGGADAILIPEIPWSMDALVDTVRATCKRRSQAFALVVVAEGRHHQRPPMADRPVPRDDKSTAALPMPSRRRSKSAPTAPSRPVRPCWGTSSAVVNQVP